MLQGGLGNQLFQYAAGRSIAEKLGARLVLDPFSGFLQDPYQRRFLLGEFAVNAEVLCCEEASRARRRHRLQRNAWWRLEHTALLLRRTYYNPWLISLARRLIDVCGELYVSGYFQSYKYFGDLAEVLRKELSVKRPVGLNRQGVEADLGNSGTVALHIRGGHGRAPTGRVVCHKWTQNVLPEVYYNRALSELEKRGVGKRCVVFTEDGYSVPRWLLKGREVSVVAGSDNTAVEDLVLLSVAKHKILANSTYSWWAGWLGNCAEGTVLAPARWFLHRARQDVRDLLLPDWHLVDW